MKRTPIARKTRLDSRSELKRAPMKRRPKRQRDGITKGGLVRSEAHRAFVRSQPSAYSGEVVGIEAHHHGRGGTGIKACDLTCCPLTWREHNEYHRTGKVGTWSIEETDARLRASARDMVRRSVEAGVLPEEVHDGS